ncbi:MAG: hypothetical protein CMJ48_13795 [Planctomycetaceae bacterium]|nr:hypothetical protein [Planctomycetaceae bacterium]
MLGLFMSAGTRTRNVLPEQRKRTRMTSRPVYNVVQEERTQFRLARRLLVPAYRLMNKPG